jgi:hypothetical protein
VQASTGERATESMQEAYYGVQEAAVEALEEHFPDKTVEVTDKPYYENPSVTDATVWMLVTLTYEPTGEGRGPDAMGEGAAIAEIANAVLARFHNDGRFVPGAQTSAVIGTGFHDLTEAETNQGESGDSLDKELIRELLQEQWSPEQLEQKAAEAVETMLTRAAEA